METEPWGNPGGRSQDGPAMDRREEARRHGRTGWPLGWRENERPLLARSSFFPPPSWKILAVAAKAVTDRQSAPVVQAIMPGTQCVHTTGEVPRRLFPRGTVTASYKQAVKGSPDASAAGTRSQWPCPRGCQQRQSSPATRDERQNRSRSIKPRAVFGTVSTTLAATKWPAGTSSWQPVDRLRNIPCHGAWSIGTIRKS